jgi:hypothetical protein
MQMTLGCFGGFLFTMTFYYKKERMGIYRLKFYYAKIQGFLLSEKVGVSLERFNLMVMNVSCLHRMNIHRCPTRGIVPPIPHLS